MVGLVPAASPAPGGLTERMACISSILARADKSARPCRAIHLTQNWWTSERAAP